MAQQTPGQREQVDPSAFALSTCLSCFRSVLRSCICGVLDALASNASALFQGLQRRTAVQAPASHMQPGGMQSSSMAREALGRASLHVIRGCVV